MDQGAKSIFFSGEYVTKLYVSIYFLIKPSKKLFHQILTNLATQRRSFCMNLNKLVAYSRLVSTPFIKSIETCPYGGEEVEKWPPPSDIYNIYLSTSYNLEIL